MFEKEAEDNKPPYAYCAIDTKCELWKDGFQKGAEFGYNKALEELTKYKNIKDNVKEKHYCDNVNCNHNNTKGLCCMFNPDNCKYRQLQKENAELKADNDARKFAMDMSEKVEKQLREENAELKNRDCWKSCEYANPKAELIGQHIKDVQILTKAKELLKWFVWYFREGSPNLVPYKHKVKEAEQFLNGKNIILEDAQVGNSPFDADEVFNKEMKAYPDETLGISDIHKYSHKLFDAFEKLEFRTTFNKAIQAFYLEEGLYVVRSHCMGKYQYTLVEASSEEMAIEKCV